MSDKLVVYANLPRDPDCRGGILLQSINTNSRTHVTVEFESIPNYFEKRPVL